MCHRRKSTGEINHIIIVSAQRNAVNVVVVVVVLLTACAVSQAYPRFCITDTFLLVICAPSTLAYNNPPLGLQMVY